MDGSVAGAAVVLRGWRRGPVVVWESCCSKASMASIVERVFSA
jgi:hypothetical protein